MRYYVIATTYEGAAGRHHDANTIEIRTKPARANLSGEVVTEGWAGTTDGWCVDALGAYMAFGDALDRVRELCPGGYRELDYWGERYLDCVAEYEGVVAIYKPGAYYPMTGEEAREWLYPGMMDDINPGTTDDELRALLEDYRAEAHDERLELPEDALEILEDYRDERGRVKHDWKDLEPERYK